jgi:hypothetical protein
LTDENGDLIDGEMKAVVDEQTGKTTYVYAFSVASAGEYTCVIHFTRENENYEEIALTVTQAVYIGSVA